MNNTDQTSSTNIVIVGGVAGGASAAARARRLNEFANITVIERGSHVSFASCALPYHIGGEITDRSKLTLQTPESLRAQLAIDILARTEATSINRQKKTLSIKNLESGQVSDLAYDKLILSPGANPLRPPLPGIDTKGIYTLRNLVDMDKIITTIKDTSRVLIIGAGFIGLEVAEQMIHLNKKVVLVELVEQVLPQMDSEMTQAVEQELMDNGVELVLGDGIDSFAETSNGIEATLKSGKKLIAEVVLLSIGVRPENQLAKDAGLKLGARGHIVANQYQQTSDPDIYAVGDASETIDPILGGPAAIALGGPANRQGRVAVDHIFHGENAIAYPGSIGTSIVRVFDIAAGVTGHSEKRLQQMGIAYKKTIVSDYNHASYFPGATHLTLKLLWEKDTGRILGGQANGYDGVDKRLDVIATAIKGKLTVEELEHIELAYAPPFGSAKDPLNTAAFSANNMRRGQIALTYELPKDENVQLVDVRPKQVADIAPIPSAITIPYAELRQRIAEIDKSKPVVTICALGKLSYFSARILKQHGYQVQSYVGGWKIGKKPQQNPSNTRKMSSTPSSPNTSSSGQSPDLSNAQVVNLEYGQILEIRSSDSGFHSDLPAFCSANGYLCLDVSKEKGIVIGRIAKQPGGSTSLTRLSTGSTGGKTTKGASLVVFSGDLDKVMASFIIANGAVAMGGEATLFFTFWGLNALRKDEQVTVQGKSFMDNMFGWILPRGATKLPLSQMHMGGMGTKMMKGRMADKKLPNLPGLIKVAQDQGVRLVACTMSMEAMGIKEEELIDGVEFGGVAGFLESCERSGTNLFI